MDGAKREFPYGRILFIGQNPAKPENESHPFEGTSSQTRILRWLLGSNLSWKDCLFINASNRLGKVTKADYAYENLGMVMYSYKVCGVVTLGTYAKTYFDQSRYAPIPSLNLPHPSPANRIWNAPGADSAAVMQLRAFWELHGLTGGKEAWRELGP